MLIWIVLYAAGFLVTLELAGMILWIDDHDHKRPVLLSLTYAVMWPVFAVSYTWVGIKLFSRHMLEEFTSG